MLANVCSQRTLSEVPAVSIVKGICRVRYGSGLWMEMCQSLEACAHRLDVPIPDLLMNRRVLDQTAYLPPAVCSDGCPLLCSEASLRSLLNVPALSPHSPLSAYLLLSRQS